MKKLTEAEIREQIAEKKERLLDVQTRGDEAISSHDLRNGYNADFYLNKCPMLQNQVNYYERMLEELYPAEPQGQLTLF